METLGVKNHNPLNIRYSERNKWIGQVGCNKGFCVFSSDYFGYRAAYKTLQTYEKRGWVTVRDIISHWAPNNENDTESYIKFVCDKCGWSEDYRVISYLSRCVLISAMAYIESRVSISPKTVWEDLLLVV